MDAATIKATADLAWFFSQTNFERSTFGVQLERAELYSTRYARRSGPLTARPGTTRQPSQAEAPDDRALLRFGDVSRRLAVVAAADPQAARALGAALSAEAENHAERWPGIGRLAALFPLVRAGRKLLEINALPERSLTATLETVLALHVVRRSSDRDTALITRATIEASELYQHALRLWIRSARTKEKTRAQQ